jgi:hypothetical protein
MRNRAQFLTYGSGWSERVKPWGVSTIERHPEELGGSTLALYGKMMIRKRYYVKRQFAILFDDIANCLYVCAEVRKGGNQTSTRDFLRLGAGTSYDGVGYQGVGLDDSAETLSTDSPHRKPTSGFDSQPPHLTQPGPNTSAKNQRTTTLLQRTTII